MIALFYINSFYLAALTRRCDERDISVINCSLKFQVMLKRSCLHGSERNQFGFLLQSSARIQLVNIFLKSRNFCVDTFFVRLEFFKFSFLFIKGIIAIFAREANCKK